MGSLLKERLPRAFTTSLPSPLLATLKEDMVCLLQTVNPAQHRLGTVGPEVVKVSCNRPSIG